MNKKRKEVNMFHLYLNMTHTGRLISKCNNNGPTPAPQSCYGQYMKKVRQFVENRSEVTVKRVPNNPQSNYIANVTSKTIADSLLSKNRYKML